MTYYSKTISQGLHVTIDLAIYSVQTWNNKSCLYSCYGEKILPSAERRDPLITIEKDPLEGYTADYMTQNYKTLKVSLLEDSQKVSLHAYITVQSYSSMSPYISSTFTTDGLCQQARSIDCIIGINDHLFHPTFYSL